MFYVWEVGHHNMWEIHDNHKLNRMLHIRVDIAQVQPWSVAGREHVFTPLFNDSETVMRTGDSTARLFIRIDAHHLNYLRSNYREWAWARWW